jgi:hypothetical protein
MTTPAQLRTQAWTVAAVTGIACGVGAFRAPEAFFQAYLVAYILVWSVAVGALGFQALYFLVGGEWGRTARRALEAASGTLPWLAILFLPIAFGLHHIYPWSHPEHLEGLSHKQAYFHLPFFFGRAIFYFGFWSWLAYRLRSIRTIEPADAPAGFYQKTAAPSLLLYVLTVSFAAIDWIMSLEPHWGSTVYGGMVMAGGNLGALCVVILVTHWYRAFDKSVEMPEKASLDLGNLVLAFTMFWTYLELSQFLIIWSADLPEEIGWYIIRSRGGWRPVATVVFLAQFFLPLFLLLSRARKKDPRRLVRVAAWVLTIRVIDTFWLIAPAFHPQHFTLRLLDVTTVAALAALWFALMLGGLQHPAVRNDSRLGVAA